MLKKVMSHIMMFTAVVANSTELLALSGVR